MTIRVASEPYVEWYSSLPFGLQLEVAIVLTTILPNNPLAGDVSNDLAPRFIDWIRESSKDRFRAAGVALALIKTTEFVFVNRRGTDEDWDVMWNRIDSRRAGALARGHHESALQEESRLLNLPDRASLWLSASEKWRKARTSLLSDDAIASCVFRKSAG